MGMGMQWLYVKYKYYITMNIINKKYYVAIILLSLFISCINNTKNIEIFDFKEVDLGTVSKNDTVHFKINVTNPMIKDLHIKKISSSCGCTLISLNDSIVKSKHQTQLNVEYITSSNNDKGSIEKAIVIETNSPQRLHEILIKAKLK